MARLVRRDYSRSASVPAQAHPRPVSVPAEFVNVTHEPPAEPELIVDVRPDEWVQFKGTAAHLVAEGVIPEGFDWPRAATDARWQTDGFDYWLRRTRPEGHKGPMRSWLELDHWFVRITVTGRDWQWAQRRAIERKARALLDEVHRQSPAGHEAQRAYWRAFNDPAFQAFKAVFVPQRKKPGRHPEADDRRRGCDGQ